MGDPACTYMYVFMCNSCILLRLEFGTAPASEPGALPTVTNDILSMVSPEKEVLPLQKVRYVPTAISVLEHCHSYATYVRSLQVLYIRTYYVQHLCTYECVGL